MKKNTNKEEERINIKKPKLLKSSSGYFYEDDTDILGGYNILKWLIYPLPTSQFFLDNWKRKPILIQRNMVKYFSPILTTTGIDSVLRKKRLYFTSNIDITSYHETNGVLKTHNLKGRATAPLVWDFYSKGCSVRILYPENYFPKVHALNAALQQYFQMFVGANAYLTPSNASGFAPHYADIEAFVIQVEGEKIWKLYAPRTKSGSIPCSSGNSYLDHPIKEVLLKAGDVMYFPRGYIHQAIAVGNKNSLHVTFSLFRKYSVDELLQENSINLTSYMKLVRAHRFKETVVKSIKPSYTGNTSKSINQRLESPDICPVDEEALPENHVNDSVCPQEIKQDCQKTKIPISRAKYLSSTPDETGLNPETAVPLRRSTRKTWQTVLYEKQKALEQHVTDRLEEDLEVHNFSGKGRGVIASRRFKKGDFVVEYIGEIISSLDAKLRELKYSQDENIGSYMFYFTYNNQKYCVDATAESGYLGRIINHSKKGNLVPKILPVDGIPHIILIAKNDILPGQELTFDYGDRSKKSLQYHPWLAT